MIASGEFVVVNKHLLSDLTNMGLWTSELKNQVIYHNGSIQQIKGIPAELKSIYRLNFLKGICWQQGFVPFRMWVTMLNLINIILLVSNLHPWLFNRTVWEIKQRSLVDMAADRGAYIDQSQSLNIHMDQPNFGKLTSLHFYTWSKVWTMDLILAEVNMLVWLLCLDKCELEISKASIDCTQQGLKTGMYYLRSRAAADAIQFTVDSSGMKVMLSFALILLNVVYVVLLTTRVCQEVYYAQLSFNRQTLGSF